MVTITQADFGKTVTAPVGATIVLGYEASGLQWTTTYDQTVLKSLATDRLQAVASGRSALESQGRPVCNPGQACPRFIQEFNATIVIR